MESRICSPSELLLVRGVRIFNYVLRMFFSTQTRYEIQIPGTYFKVQNTHYFHLLLCVVLQLRNPVKKLSFINKDLGRKAMKKNLAFELIHRCDALNTDSKYYWKQLKKIANIIVKKTPICLIEYEVCIHVSLLTCDIKQVVGRRFFRWNLRMKHMTRESIRTYGKL